MAAVPVRRTPAGELEFLVVRTSKGDRWTFPKGGVERGESLPAAAAREAREEAGVTGTVSSRPLGTYRYAASRNGHDDVTAFLLEVDRDGLEAEPGRDPTWCEHDAAVRKLAERRRAGYAKTMKHLLRRVEPSQTGPVVT